MGYYINVNHNKFQEVSNKIDDYIQQQDTCMNRANEQMELLFQSWSGTDADSLKSQWNNVESGSSVTMRMKKSLKSYSLGLKEASYQYKNAQSLAINDANRLLLW